MNSLYPEWYTEYMGRPLYRLGLRLTGGSRIGGLIGANTPGTLSHGVLGGIFSGIIFKGDIFSIAIASTITTGVSYLAMVPLLYYLNSPSAKKMRRETRRDLEEKLKHNI